MDARKIIGINIRRFRKEIDWTQEKLAVRLKVSNEFISRLEHGTEYPSIRLLEQMAKLVDHKLFEFFIEH
ncbi:MAG: helix-turn-helix transcriptional regulator [Bacteroidetes bacterium]|nr:helix-turn-helix transcriptional regulator [Bacteroidota bacterium]